MKKLDEIAVYAHRGVHDNKTVFENTMPAIRLAGDMGIGAEIDVRLTSDGVAVIHHDPKTLSGDRISQMPYDDLKNYRFPDGSSVPTLESVMSEFGGRIALLIEIKSTGPSGTVARKTWEAIKGRTDGVTVQSFDPLMLRRFRRMSGGTVRCGLLSAAYAVSDGVFPYLHGKLLFSPFSKADFISYRSDSAAARVLQRLRSRKTRFGLWSVGLDSADDHRDGADFYICDVLPPEKEV